jgi:hypothetical protein
MKSALIVSFLFISALANAQPGSSFDKPRDLTAIKMNLNTEKLFVYIKPNAKIYFRVSDIIEYIDSISNTNNFLQIKNLIVLKDILLLDSKQIEITDYCYSFDNEKREKIIKKHKINNIDIQINQCFEYIGSDLILQGKFMVYSLKYKDFIFEGLKAEKSEGLYGTEYLDFIFPDKTKFYSIVVALGE